MRGLTHGNVSDHFDSVTRERQGSRGVIESCMAVDTIATRLPDVR